MARCLSMLPFVHSTNIEMRRSIVFDSVTEHRHPWFQRKVLGKRGSLRYEYTMIMHAIRRSARPSRLVELLHKRFSVSNSLHRDE